MTGELFIFDKLNALPASKKARFLPSFFAFGVLGLRKLQVCRLKGWVSVAVEVPLNR